MITKQQLMDETSTILGIRRFEVSTGSTEPRDFFLGVIDALGISSNFQKATKQELAKLIVESSGMRWKVEYDSTGATVTTAGLNAVKEAVEFFQKTSINRK